MTSISPTGQSWPSATNYPSVPAGNNAASQDNSNSSNSSSNSAPPVISPSTHVDPQTGIAVLVVLDDAGQVTQQIPTRQVIDEYRRHQDPNSLAQAAHASHAAPTPEQAAPQVAGSAGAQPGSDGSSQSTNA